MDAPQLLDGMLSVKKPKNTEAPSMASMDDLQEDVLPIIVSFLPAHEAVRTCVLAKRWRHVWTSAPALHITAVRGFGSADKFNHFVDRLLSLRRHAHRPLESCEFDLDEAKFDFGWILSAQHVYRRSLQSALDCNVKFLRCCFTPTQPTNFPRSLTEPAEPLHSQHIQRLELHYTRATLDFSGCPALVDLKMKDCITLDDNMAAPSLERLSMTWCELPEEHRNSISLPSLVHLELIECFGRLPVLESLPSLETGIVRLGENSGDQCFRSVRGCYTYSPCQDCHFAIDFAIARGRSYFFEGLSRATHLELSSPFEYALIFQRDLSWCPTFPMLNTLVLDDWCLDDDLSAVFDSLMVREGSYYHPWKGAFASDHLKMVEIKCEEFDERVKKVLKILSTFGISLEKIHIRLTDTSSGSECFHFVCTGFSHS